LLRVTLPAECVEDPVDLRCLADYDEIDVSVLRASGT
jgi:hypothetical protein